MKSLLCEYVLLTFANNLQKLTVALGLLHSHYLFSYFEEVYNKHLHYASCKTFYCRYEQHNFANAFYAPISGS